MGVSYGKDRGGYGYAMKSRQVRKCNTCGYTANVLYNSHRIYRDGKRTYCGYMRVVNEGQE